MTRTLPVIALCVLLMGGGLSAAEYQPTTQAYPAMLRAMTHAMQHPDRYVVAQISLREMLSPNDHRPNGRPLLKDSREFINLRRDRDVPPVRLARIERIISGHYDEPIVLYYDRPLTLGHPDDPEDPQVFGISEGRQQSYLAVFRRFDPSSPHTGALTWDDPDIPSLPILEIAAHGYAVWDIEEMTGPGHVIHPSLRGEHFRRQRKHTRPHIGDDEIDELAAIVSALDPEAESGSLIDLRASHPLAQSVHWEIVRERHRKQAIHPLSRSEELRSFMGGDLQDQK